MFIRYSIIFFIIFIIAAGVLYTAPESLMSEGGEGAEDTEVIVYPVRHPHV